MRTLLHHKSLIEAVNCMNKVEILVGPLVLCAEWTAQKDRLRELATQCLQNGRMMVDTCSAEDLPSYFESMTLCKNHTSPS